MPVSHVGLTVENLPASTSFFLSALRPLGYRYVGTQNDQIGFGVKEADFFLGSIPDYSNPSPIHVAFAASNKTAVRDFYKAALEAGGTPAGSPSYRGENHDIFNAAVLDLDGNTIEVVHHRCQNDSASTVKQRSARSASILKLQPRIEGKDYRAADFDDEATDSAVDLPRTTSAIRRPSLPSQLGSQSSKTPANSLFSTVIGAAAGAAAIYAFYSTERDSAREEKAYNVRISRRHASTGVRTSSSNYYRRHSEPMVDTSTTRRARQKHNKSDGPPEMPLFHQSFTYNPPPSHPSNTIHRNKIYDTGIDTIAEASECPELPATKYRSTTSDTLRQSHRHNQDKTNDRSRRRLLEQRSPSRQQRSRSRSRNPTSRHTSPPRHRSQYNHSPTNHPLPSSRTESRHTASPRCISAALNDIHHERQDDTDTSTVVPDESISCVDLRPRRRRGPGFSSHSRQSKDSKQSKHSKHLKHLQHSGGYDRDRDRIGGNAKRHGFDEALVAERESHRYDQYDGYDRYDRHDRHDGRDRYIDTGRAGKRSSATSLPNRPRVTTHQYRYENRARSRSREKSHGSDGRREVGKGEFDLVYCAR